MRWVLMAMALLVATGLAALAAGARPRLASALATAGTLLACGIGLPPCLRALGGGEPESWRVAWNVPGGSFHVALDALSAFFLIPIFALAALAAVYGGPYLLAFRDRKSLGSPFFFTSLFVAAMALVVVARNAVLFMMAWEVMSLSAFFLVTFEHEKREVRGAGWIYLVAAHLGAGCLLLLFLLLGHAAGSFEFEAFAAAGGAGPAMATLLFVLAVIGFGTKAGLVPLHVWLPEAHPAAPSHISALMSGVMIKIGMYGLLRIMTCLGSPAAWWGTVLVLVGLLTAGLGVGLAVIQRDVKRALAYSSIENMGLVTLALGIGLWGLTSGHLAVAVLGLAGGLFHLWNHALMKGLMFLCAGSVLHGTGTLDMEKLGGLMKRMPRTGLFMAAGAVAMAALPPLNGFLSEWLIYLGLLKGALAFSGAQQVILLLAFGLLAFVGGLALLCFVRLLGVVLLGEARSSGSQQAHESSVWMVAPCAVLLLLSIGFALFPRAVTSAFAPVVAEAFGVPSLAFRSVLTSPDSPLTILGYVNGGVVVAVAAVAFVLFLLRRRTPEAAAGTWGCGYAAPTARMQYTGQSFAELMVSRLFPRPLRPQTEVAAPRDLFPAAGTLTSSYPDPLRRDVYEPLFARWAQRCARLRWLQQGRLHIYLLYFVVVLVLAFVWLTVREVLLP